MKKVTKIQVNDIDSLEFELKKEAQKQSNKKHYVNNKELFKAFQIYNEKKVKLKAEHTQMILKELELTDISELEEQDDIIIMEFVRGMKEFIPPPLSDKIGQAIMDISYRRCYSPRFVNYSPNWKEEMICDAIETCVKYAHNFDPTKYNNPFAYLTQLVTNAVFQRIKKEHKQQYIKLKLFDDSHGFAGDIDENNINQEDMQIVDETNDMYQDRLSYIDNYEHINGMNKIRAKRKKQGEDENEVTNILDMD